MPALKAITVAGFLWGQASVHSSGTGTSVGVCRGTDGKYYLDDEHYLRKLGEMRRHKSKKILTNLRK